MQADGLKNSISYGLILLCAVVLAWQIPAFANELSLGALVRLILAPVVLFMVLFVIVQTWERGGGLLHFHLYGGKLTGAFLFVVALLSGTLIIYYGPRFNLLAWPVFVLVVICYFLALYFVIVGKEHNALFIFLLSLPWLDFVEWEVGVKYGIFNIMIGDIALPIKGAYIFIVSLFVVWVASRQIQKRFRLAISWIYIPIVLLIFCILISLFLFTYSHNIEIGVIALVRIVTIPFIFFILVIESIDTEHKLYLIIYSIIAMAVMSSFIQFYMTFRTTDAVLELEAMPTQYELFRYGTGTLSALPSALITPLLIALLLTVKARRYLLLTAGLLVYAVALQLMSFSRAHLLGTLSGAACLLSKRRALLLAMLALTVALLFWEPFYNVVLVRFHNIRSLEDLTLEHLSYTRYHGWIAAIGMMSERPILGVGLGNFLDYAPRYSGKVYLTILPTGEKYFNYMANAHNLFLNLGAQLGFIGLTLLILFLGMLLFELLKGLIAVKGSRLEPIGWGLLGVYVAHIIIAMFGDGFWIVKVSMVPNILYWALFALMVRLRSIGNKMKSGVITENGRL